MITSPLMSNVHHKQW